MDDSNPYSAPESSDHKPKRHQWPFVRDILLAILITVFLFWSLGALVRYLVDGEFSWI